MEKLDLKKEFKEIFNPPKKNPVIVQIPEFQYLIIEGIGADADNAHFQNAIQALFTVSFKTKFNIKNERQIDYAVMPLQGQWWADDMEDFIKGNKKKWRWNLMILQPDFVSETEIKKSIKSAESKIPAKLLSRMEFKKFEEGRAASIMHVGPYSEEHANIMKMHKLIEESGGKLDGYKHKHHEIYISDFRRTAPERLKTVLRQPF